MKINSFIFKELLKRSFTLEGKTRVWNLADSKLWYLTPSQSQGFLDLESTKDYRRSIISKEIMLIRDNLKSFLKTLAKSSYNIIDLGCGNGEKGALFIKELSRFLKVRYCPIDISSYMVEMAAKTVKALKVGEVVEFKWNISDFENLSNVTPLLKQGEFKNNFLLLLGNTLGNFDRDDILNGIAEGMQSGDVLIIGNGISNGKKEDWVKTYKNKLIDKWLIQVPIQLGLDKDSLIYDVRFVDSRVEEFYVLKRDKTIRHLGKTVQFKKGDVILVAISYKYTKDALNKNLNKFFKNVNVVTDKEETYALALCQK